MFAVFETGGKQYKVAVGDVVEVEKIEKKVDDDVVFLRVLLLDKDDNTLIGTPLLENVKVKAKVVTHDRNDKIRVVKFQPKKRRKTVNGHRQHFTKLKILDIEIS